MPEELPYHPLPGQIVCSGRRYLDILKSAGFPPDLLVPGPNLRYTDVNRFAGAGAPDVSGPQTLLIILNYDSNQNMELLEKAGQALKNPGDLRILIKAHPTTDTQKMSAFLRDIRFPRHEWASGDGHGASCTGARRDDDRGVRLQHGSDCRRGPPGPGFAGEQLRFRLSLGRRAGRAAGILGGISGVIWTKRSGRTAPRGKRLRRFGKTMVESYFEPVTAETLRVFL